MVIDVPGGPVRFVDIVVWLGRERRGSPFSSLDSPGRWPLKSKVHIGRLWSVPTGAGLSIGRLEVCDRNAGVFEFDSLLDQRVDGGRGGWRAHLARTRHGRSMGCTTRVTFGELSASWFGILGGAHPVKAAFALSSVDVCHGVNLQQTIQQKRGGNDAVTAHNEGLLRQI